MKKNDDLSTPQHMAMGRQGIVFERLPLPAVLAAGEAEKALGVPTYSRNENEREDCTLISRL
jgi:hypothetical protein